MYHVYIIPHSIADEGDDLAQPVLLKALQLAPTIATHQRHSTTTAQFWRSVLSYDMHPLHLPTCQPASAGLATRHTPALLSVHRTKEPIPCRHSLIQQLNVLPPSYRTPAGHCRARHLPRRGLRLHRCPAQSTWGTGPPHHRGSLSSHSRGPDAAPQRVLA